MDIDENELTNQWLKVIEPPHNGRDWIWRTGAFAGAFADAYIQNTSLEGGGVPATLELLIKITRPLIECDYLTKNHLSLFSRTDIQNLRQIYEDFSDAVKYGRELFKMNNKIEEFSKFLEFWMDKVDKLEVGKRLIINGGWLIASKSADSDEIRERGHATLYIVERDDIDRYGFVVVNTGEGNLYHPFYRGDYPKEKRRSAIRIGEITRSRIMEQGFWFLLFKMRYQSSSVHGPLQLYEVLLPFLSNPSKPFDRNFEDIDRSCKFEEEYENNFEDLGTMSADPEQPTRIHDCTIAMNLDRELRRGNCGDFETMQRSGTCFYRAILGAIRYCCKRVGFSVLQRKQLMYAFRMAFLFTLKADLIHLNDYLEMKIEQSNGVNNNKTLLKARYANSIPKLSGGWQHSDIRMINVACDVTALATVKEAKRGTLGKYGMYLIRSLTNNLRIISESIGRGVGAPSSIQVQDQTEKDQSNCSDYLMPFTGMNYHSYDLSEEYTAMFSGCKEELKESLFVDLYESSEDNFTNLSEIIDLFHRTVKRCDVLQSKIFSSSTSIPTHQICVLIERLFCEVIPLPKPRSSSNKDLWNDFNCLTLEEQRKGLHSLRQLAIYYISSSFVLPVQDKHAESSRIIVLFSILICFDSIVRINCRGKDGKYSPIATVFQQQDLLGDRSFWISSNAYLESVSLKSLFATIIARNASQQFTLTKLISYLVESESALKRDDNSLGPMLLFDLHVDPVRRLTQFRIDQSDPTMDFIQNILDLTEGKEITTFSSKNFSPPSVPSSPQPSQLIKSSPAELGIPSSPISSPSLESPFPLPPTPPPVNIIADPKSIEVINPSDLKEKAGSLKSTPLSKLAEIRNRLKSSFTTLAIKHNVSMDSQEKNLQAEESQEKVEIMKKKITWFCAKESEWNEKGCPEFAWMRDIVTLARLTLEPTPILLKKNPYLAQSKFFSFNSFIPEWDFQDVTSSNVKCGFHICFQKTLSLGSTHPYSPVREENYTPSTTSQIPKTKHFFVDLLNGRNPSFFNQKHSKEIILKISEVDVLRLEVLPTFDNNLSEEESLQLLSLLTVPYLNIPLILNFFANDLIGSLLNPKLQQILEYSLFEPRNYLSHINYFDIVPLNPNDKEQFGSKYGLLFKELLLTPDCVLQPLLDLISECSDYCIGTYDSPFAKLLLFFIRITVRILNYRELNLKIAELKEKCMMSTYATILYECLYNKVFPKINILLEQATLADDISYCVTLRAHLTLIAHILFLYGNNYNIVDSSSRFFSSMITNASYVISWHSKIQDNSQAPILTLKDLQPMDFKKNDDNEISRPISSLPIYEIFYIVEQCRNRILELSERNSPEEIENTLFQISELSLHLISNAPQEQMPNDPQDTIQNDWNESDSDDETNYSNINLRYTQKDDLLSSLRMSSNQGQRLWVNINYKDVGLLGNSKIPGVWRHSTQSIEVNLQTLEVYFRSRSMFPTPLDILEHSDFTEVIPKGAQPYCVIVSEFTNRKHFNIIHENTCYQIETWSPLNNYSKLQNIPYFNDDQSVIYLEFKYNQYQKQSLGWFSELFDNTFYQMAEAESLKCTIWTLSDIPNENLSLPQLIIHAQISEDSQFYAVFPITSKECYHIYSFIEIGRRSHMSLVYTSDCNWSHSYIQPSCTSILSPWYPGTEQAAGDLNVDSKGQSQSKIDTILIRREIQAPIEIINYFNSSDMIPLNESTLEEYIPIRSLYGLIPETLLDAFQFWKVRKEIIIGYPKPNVQSPSGKTILEWWGSSYLLHITLVSKNNNCGAIIRRIPKMRNDPNFRPMVLLNSLHADSSSPISKISKRMIQLDSLSHVLIWSYSLAEIGEEAEISLVELPRLKLRFAMQLPESSLSSHKRLFSLDHNDLFMTEDIDENRLQVLEAHSSCLLHGLVMENRFNQLFLLVPNYGLRRISIRSCPFSTPMRSIRDDQWSNNVRTRYYLYPIHLSGSFILMNSLAGTLYLILLRFLQRHYSEASALLTSCSADSTFNEEEKWILQHIKLTEHDFHPDAHAIRLRIAIMCLEHSPSVVTWDVEDDLFGYLHKYSHISSNCKLSTEEERLLLEAITQRQDGNVVQFYTIIRLRYLNTLDVAKARNEPINLEFPIQTRYGGARLRSLYVHADQYCKEHFMRTKHYYYNYNRPKPLMQGLEAVQYLMNLYDDSMTGQDFRTGFIAIIELLFGKYQLQIVPGVTQFTSKEIELNSEFAKDFDFAIFDSILRNDESNGSRIYCHNINLVKLLIHSLFFRYITARGVPPETAPQLASLSLLLSMIDSDREYKNHSWRVPTFPYQHMKPLMDVVRPDAHPSMRQGIWGDKATGSAIIFENLLTEAVAYHCNSDEWKDNPGFHFPLIAKNGYYCERGNPSVISVNPNTLLDCRPEIENFDCYCAVLQTFDTQSLSDISLFDGSLSVLNITREDIAAFAGQPLSPIDLTKYVVFESSSAIVNVESPFAELEKKPVSQSSVAKNILHRIENDIKVASQENQSFPRISTLLQQSIDLLQSSFNEMDPFSDSSNIEKGVKRLHRALSHVIQLHKSLQSLLQNDNVAISKGVIGVEQLANQFPVEPTIEEVNDDNEVNIKEENFIYQPTVLIEKLSFLLERQAGQRSWLTFHLLCRALMSKDPWIELKKYNPFLSEERCKTMLLALTGVLFRSVRISQINVCIASALQLITAIKVAIGYEMERRLIDHTKILSLSMKLNALEKSNYEISSATELIEELLNNLMILQEYTSGNPSLANLSSRRRYQLCYVVFHYCDFDVELSKELLLQTDQTFLLILAKKYCYYKGKELILPPTVNMTDSKDSIFDLAKSVEVDLTHSAEISSESKLSATVHLIQHTAEQLASNLTAHRSYVAREEGNENSVCNFDPRFLVFEFVSNFLLKERQIELVNNFIDSYREGKSCVHQMIMGAGKTTVICPLLALLLADGKSLVTLVIPSALLDMSRDVMRTCFSNVIVKKVYSFHFDRSTASKSATQLATIRKLRIKLEIARDQRGIVCTTPEVIKSLMLMYIDILATLEHQETNVLKDVLSSPFDSSDIRPISLEIENQIQTANEIAKILLLWGNNSKGDDTHPGIALLDEVDVILHPLHSELNFPIGEKVPLPLSPKRWRLPFHLIDSLFCGEFSDNEQFPTSSKSRELLEQIVSTVNNGIYQLCLQNSPHLVLVQKWFYDNEIRPLLAEWAIIWLNDQPEIQKDIIHIGENEFTSKLMLDYISVHNPIEEVNNNITSHFSTISIQYLNLTRDWILSYLPHCLSKIDRVHYGLLQKRDIERLLSNLNNLILSDREQFDQMIAKTRKLLGVPFVGKDVPSQSSEFSHPDVLIGLSIFAYRYEGLREEDVKSLIKYLKQKLLVEAGIVSMRPSNMLYEGWLRRAKELRSSSTHPKHLLPLEVIQPEDIEQIINVKELLGKRSEVIEYYLDNVIFPQTMHHQPIKLQATGQDLGSDMIFGMRLGFSGTPSDCLPYSLHPCQYEKGSEAKVIETLTQSDVISVEILEDWNVISLIDHITDETKSFNCLIDAGALITGMNNEQVAKALLEDRLPHMSACVYLDDFDRKMVVDRTNSKPIPLNRSGVPLHKRFTFYDQVHTTGMDIQQPINARAVLLLGKDMTLRDYAQACWRMRGLGRGQSVHVIVVREVYSLIQTISCSGNLLLDIVNWLLFNSIKSEHEQRVQLCQQDISYSWRKRALSDLLLSISSSSSNNVSSNPNLNKSIEGRIINPRDENAQQIDSSSKSIEFIFKDNSKINFSQLFFTKINEENVNQKNISSIKLNETEENEIFNRRVKCVSLFKEPIDFQVQGKIRVFQERWKKMEQRVDEFRDFIIDSDHSQNHLNLNKIIRELVALESEAIMILQNEHNLNDNEKYGGAAIDFDAEIVQEQQQQQQQQVQSAVGNQIEYSMERSEIKYWSIDQLKRAFGILQSSNNENNENNENISFNVSYLLRENEIFSFAQLSNIKLASMMDRSNETSISFPERLLISTNHTQVEHEKRSPLQRRLRSAFIVMNVNAETETYSFVITLAEAETIRHHLLNQILSSKYDPNFKITMHTSALIPNRSLFEYSSMIPLFNSLERKFESQPNDKNEFNVHLQCVRFFNCDFKLNGKDLTFLLEGLSKSSTRERKKYFALLLLCHKREVVGWEMTSISLIFKFETQQLMENITQYQSKLRKYFIHRYHSLISAFQYLDSDHDGIITYTELLDNLRASEEPFLLNLESFDNLFNYLFATCMEELELTRIQLSVNQFVQLISS